MDHNDELYLAEMWPIEGPFLSRTRRKGMRLNDNGFSYFRERRRGDVTYWRCSDKKCKGRVVQRDEMITRTKGHNHSHSPVTFDGGDIFLGRVELKDDQIGYERMVTVPTEGLSQLGDDHDDGDFDEDNIQGSMVVWENDNSTEGSWKEDSRAGDDSWTEDIKPDINQLKRLIRECRTVGTNTEPDSLQTENAFLKMKVQRLEMELLRYKQTFSRIRADLDMLDRI